MIGNKNIYLNYLAAMVILICAAGQAMADEGIVQKTYFGVAVDAKKAVKPKYDESLTADLIYRVAFSRAEDVQILLDHGANPDARNNAGMPVLMLAVTRKDNEAPKIVQSLIKAGGNINVTAADGSLPVTEAVRKGRPDVLQILIDSKTLLGNIRDSSGLDLLTIAENRGDAQIVNILNAGLQNEKDKISALQSKDNFIKMVQDYSFLNCANEYLNYYIASEPTKLDIVKFDKVISQNAAEIEETGSKIKYIFKMGDNELRGIKTISRGMIVERLDGLVTNRNREINGVGTDADLNEKCMIIAKKWNGSRVNGNQYKFNTQ